MTIIITMAGMGMRFRNAGYTVPKYMIEAKGKTLFEWSMDSLLGFKEKTLKYIFIVRKEDDASNFIKEKCRYYNINDLEILEIDYLTDGQATTCLLAIPHLNVNDAIMVYNIDTYVEPYEMKWQDIKGDGFIPCFQAEGTHWSFVKTDKQGKVIEVREKERISNNCTLGAYYFSSAKLFKDLYEGYYLDCDRKIGQERYIAPLYNYMITKGMEVDISIVDKTKVHVLGTPEELLTFLQK